MKTLQRTIWLQQQAPAKPALGQACNGCGVCCAAEPCPVARVFFRQRKGACRALLWDEGAIMYRCGLLVQPASYVGWLRILPPRLQMPAQAIFKKMIRRWIASGIGCDSDAEAINIDPQ